MRSMSLTFSILYLVMSIALFYAAAKHEAKRRTWFGCGVLLLSGAILCGVNVGVLSMRLMGPGLCAPIGLFLLLLGVDTERDYSRCRQPVEAICVGCVKHSHRGVTTVRPKFRYRYQGRPLEGLGLNIYSKAAFDGLLDQDEPLTVHIDPDHPLVCVHKPTYRHGSAIFILITGAVFLLFAAALLILG